MKYDQLKIKPQSRGRRVGRGISAGQGKTAGRGTKGQGSRAGFTKKPGFAGGTNPLMQQLPKLPGFRSHRPRAINVYTGQLEALKTANIDAKTLKEAGLIRDETTFVKLIVKGELAKKLAVKLPAASASAISRLEAAGGSFEKVDRLKKEVKAKPAA